jgi:outer membrane receptor for Fe3+-dicitrate
MKLFITCLTLALACGVYAGEGCCKDKDKAGKDKKDKKAESAQVTGSKLDANSTLTVQSIDERALRYNGVTSVETGLGRMPGVYIRGK